MIPKPHGGTFDMFEKGNRALSGISNVSEGAIHHQGRSIREKVMHRREGEFFLRVEIMIKTSLTDAGGFYDVIDARDRIALSKHQVASSTDELPLRRTLRPPSCACFIGRFDRSLCHGACLLNRLVSLVKLLFLASRGRFIKSFITVAGRYGGPVGLSSALS